MKIHFDTGIPHHNHAHSTPATRTKDKRRLTCQHCRWKYAGGPMPYKPARKKPLRKHPDTKRLDWLTGNPRGAIFTGPTGWGAKIRRGKMTYHQTPRQAIDAAVRSERKCKTKKA